MTQHDKEELRRRVSDSVGALHDLRKRYDSRFNDKDYRILTDAISALCDLPAAIEPTSTNWTCPDCCKQPCKCEILPKSTRTSAAVDEDGIVSIRDIMGAMASNAFQQHPYNAPPNIALVVAAIKAHAKETFSTIVGDFMLHKFDSWQDMEKWLREALTEQEDILQQWNTPAKDNGSEYLFVSRYDYPDAERDFIDIDALIRNVVNDCMVSTRTTPPDDEAEAMKDDLTNYVKITSELAEELDEKDKQLTQIREELTNFIRLTKAGKLSTCTKRAEQALNSSEGDG